MKTAGASWFARIRALLNKLRENRLSLRKEFPIDWEDGEEHEEFTEDPRMNAYVRQLADISHQNQ